MKENKERNLKEIVARRIELFKKKPEAALYRPTVSSTHVSGLYTETKVREHLLKSDYGEAAGGTNLAPNPIELLLTAIAACIEAAFYEFAVHEGFTINALSVNVEGTLDLRGLFMIDNVAAGFKEVKYTFTIDTPEDEEKIRKFAERVIAHCPVVDSLINPTRVSGEIRVKE
ncbi:MAG TPA: OsmC family protein [Thermodesulfovibrionales bacterium]|nr:OsmC family protein [Thermodesulfovibrionales bacterium]